MKVESLYPQFSSRFRGSSSIGFTLLEMLVVIAIIGIISAIAAPSWLTFLDVQRLNTGQSQIQRALEEAKSNAKRDKMTWQVSFREQNNTSQWLVHPRANTVPTNNWNSLDPAIRIDEAETTFVQSNGIWRVQFNYKGNLNGQLGRVTFVARQGGKAKRCVITSTLIGAIRTAKERPTQQNGRFCY